MIVKNEEKLLSRCLDSVSEADEIVVCDTGSTDKTVEIAKKYTDRVFTDYKWNDNFAQARNHAKNKCTGDWILSIDADEVLEDGGIEKIRDAIAVAKDTDLALNVTMVSENKTNTFLFPRLYRKYPIVHWRGAIHNHLSVPALNSVDVSITYGYSPTHKNDPDRALRILKREIKKDPSLVRERYYLAREYFYRKKWKTAIKHYKIYLKANSWGPQRAEAYLTLARCYWHLKQLKEAQDSCLKAIRINANFKEAIEFMASISGPKNRERWDEFAKTATNEDVLFVRGSSTTTKKKEKGASYYDAIFGQSADMSRYNGIYKVVGDWVDNKKCLDVGCGVAALKDFVVNYRGFDFSKKAVEVANDDRVVVGDIYERLLDKSVDGWVVNWADILVFLEVFEHLDDLRVVEMIPYGMDVIFSVPSFDDPGHLRTFDSVEAVKARYEKYFDIKEIVTFEWDGVKEWVERGEKPTDDRNIFLVKAKKR